MIAEYQFVNKPIIFLTREGGQFNDLAYKIFEASYLVDGKDLDAIAATIQKVFIEGNDDKAAARKEVFNKYLNCSKFNGLCDKSIVGVKVEEPVEYKHKRAIIPFEDRLEIVRSIKYVDAAIPKEEIDKFAAWEKLKFDILFVGDDRYQSESRQAMEEKFRSVGVKVIYFPYTKGVSSTVISQALKLVRKID